MILWLISSMLLQQLHSLGSAWLGAGAPDPCVWLAALAALRCKPASLPFAAIGLGWGRALVLGEPAGGAILCAWGALALVSAQRGALDSRSSSGFVAACLLAAVCWAALAAVLGLSGGWGLFVAGLAAWPLASLFHMLRRRRRRGW